MVIEKDWKLKRKVLEEQRKCKICNKPISEDDIKNNNFEYTESGDLDEDYFFSESFYHTKCVKEVMKKC